MKKRVFALIGIVLLIGMYLADLVLALCGNPEAPKLLLASLACTVLIPIVLYGIFVVSGGNKERYEEELRRVMEENPQKEAEMPEEPAPEE